jgi:lysophospholipase L1-like esterase
LERIEEVVAVQPDLVLIGYGMNDQNRNSDGSNFVSVQTYERNIRQMIDVIRSRTGADILLFTSCLPNPRWIFASDNVRDYADALRRIAADSGAALADVQTRWEQVLSTGKSHESLLLNNVNDPNDYGHELYYSVLNQYLD